MPLKWFQVDKCCICVTDLKTAVSIIAVLGIVTSPLVSWAIIRHSYVLRVSSYLTYSKTRADLLDFNLNKVISFGFGANAGLGHSCLSHLVLNDSSNSTDTALRSEDAEAKELTSGSIIFYAIVEYFGYFVFFIDMIFLIACVNLLIKIFRGRAKTATWIFIWTAIAAIFLSFIYGMLYVSACVSIGGAFPLFEFVFCILDVILWAYFLTVVNSYRNTIGKPITTPGIILPDPGKPVPATMSSSTRNNDIVVLNSKDIRCV